MYRQGLLYWVAKIPSSISLLIFPLLPRKDFTAFTFLSRGDPWRVTSKHHLHPVCIFSIVILSPDFSQPFDPSGYSVSNYISFYSCVPYILFPFLSIGLGPNDNIGVPAINWKKHVIKYIIKSQWWKQKILGETSRVDIRSTDDVNIYLVAPLTSSVKIYNCETQFPPLKIGSELVTW